MDKHKSIRENSSTKSNSKAANDFVNSRGQKYCIIETSLQEFLAWENMSWE
jgi:hypothetical protein